MYKPYKKTNTQSGKQSFPDSKSDVDTSGYMTLERRIKSLQHAGQILRQSRDAQFDGYSDNYVAPPHRGLQPDLADLAEMQREHQIRMNGLKQKFNEQKELLKQSRQASKEAKDNKTSNDDDAVVKKTKPVQTNTETKETTP